MEIGQRQQNLKNIFVYSNINHTIISNSNTIIMKFCKDSTSIRRC